MSDVKQDLLLFYKETIAKEIANLSVKPLISDDLVLSELEHEDLKKMLALKVKK